jgi:surface antigen
MLRSVFLAAALLLVPIWALPAPASAAAAAQSRTGERCDEQNQRNRSRGRGLGGILGGVANRIVPFGGVVGQVLPVGQLLGEAIASLLDCREQRQAANATEEATRGNVGTTATWTSETRANVTGSSTVTAAQREPDGDQCLIVTDVVIIDGQETSAPKRMCRRPPNNRYVRV